MAQSMRAVMLGTAGGPAWWAYGEARERAGISTAVVVGERSYVVDFGMGACRRYATAGLRLQDLGAGFVTHLHSDHVTDLANLLLFGMYAFDEHPGAAIPIYGPGDRGKLPPVNPFATSRPEPLFPDDPTPGIEGLVSKLLAGYATDLNERVLDSLRVPPSELFEARDIALPEGVAFDPDTTEPPRIAPFEVFQDDRVRVTATLVQHPPMAPAFGFRIESEEGSVTISGDTAPCENLIELAEGTDLLIHEAIDPAHIRRRYGDRTDPLSEASREHHRKSHTLPVQAGEVAAKAGAKTLALHHLVPGNAPRAAWEAASETFGGSVLIPEDLDEIPIPARRGTARCATPSREGQLHAPASDEAPRSSVSQPA